MLKQATEQAQQIFHKRVKAERLSKHAANQ
jgi:hypothetical protein